MFRFVCNGGKQVEPDGDTSGDTCNLLGYQDIRAEGESLTESQTVAKKQYVAVRGKLSKMKQFGSWEGGGKGGGKPRRPRMWGITCAGRFKKIRAVSRLPTPRENMTGGKPLFKSGREQKSIMRGVHRRGWEAGLNVSIYQDMGKGIKLIA